MNHYVGIDVSLEAPSLCVVDGNGKIVREGKFVRQPDALDLVLLGSQRREAIERTHDLADRVGGDARVARCRFQLRMSEQDRMSTGASSSG
jgi:hypothetical protein